MRSSDLLFWQVIDEALWEYKKQLVTKPNSLKHAEDVQNIVQDIMSDIDYHGEVQKDLDWNTK